MSASERTSDYLRELRILHWRALLLMHSNVPALRRAAWEAMRNEINSRSAAQVRRMEEKRGLI